MRGCAQSILSPGGGERPCTYGKVEGANEIDPQYCSPDDTTEDRFELCTTLLGAIVGGLLYKAYYNRRFCFRGKTVI